MYFKEEIKAVYGYERVYAIPTVSNVDKLKYSDEHRQQEQTEQQENAVKFAEVFERSLNVKNNEVQCATHGYGRSGAYQEFIYFTREYRR